MSQLTRRGFAAGVAGAAAGYAGASPQRPLSIVVWDERQPEQKQGYGGEYLGNTIAAHLASKASSGGSPAWKIESVGQDDPSNGLPKPLLDSCDVLLWWGHKRHGEVPDPLVSDIVRRVKEGRIGFLPIHSGHWSKPFRRMMEEISVENALKGLTDEERKGLKLVVHPAVSRLMKRDEPATPWHKKKVNADGSVEIEVQLPSCAFPEVDAHGKPSHVRVVTPKHPIMKGLPAAWDIPQTEMYDELFHVPDPDTVLLEERWDAGHRFRGGCVWKFGKGDIVYFRPGHETFPVFRQAENLLVIENAVRWLGSRKRR
jgi:trehalose utilization protein